jgi:hypothetical protein
MHHSSMPQPRSIDIHTPCPKTWKELVGNDRRRFCEACSLHVHNAAEMTRGEAETLVADSASRVCMRMEYDAKGQPVFRDAARTEPVRPIQRWSRWMLTAAAGVMAACTDSGSNVAATSEPRATQPAVSTKMGKAAPVEKMGDVAMPMPPRPEQLGGMTAEPLPVAPDVFAPSVQPEPK